MSTRPPKTGASAAAADDDERPAPSAGSAPEYPTRAIKREGDLRGPGGTSGLPGPIGHFQIVRLLGAGGMGVVYAAHDTRLDRKVALKVLRSGAESSAEADRLVREAKSMARVSHPNVVPVYEVGTVEGRVYVVMELVRGATLRRWLAERERDWQDVLEVLGQAGEGLAAAHKSGVVHRDFKPENILVGADGRVRVVDFGLAHEQRLDGRSSPPQPQPEEPTRDPTTITSAVMGTPPYMAPEQHLGLETDERTDQFSYCVVLYEALFGFRPFMATDLTGLVRAVTRGEVPEPPADSPVPAQITAAVVRGLASDPGQRHRSMRDLLAELWEAGGYSRWGRRQQPGDTSARARSVARTSSVPQETPMSSRRLRTSTEMATPVPLPRQSWMEPHSDAVPAARVRNARDLLPFLERYRRGTREGILSRLPPDLRAYVEQSMRTAWITLEADAKIVDAIVDHLGEEGASDMWRTYTRSFVESPWVKPLFETVRKLGLSVRAMGRQVPRVWNQSFRHAGEMVAIPQDDRSMILMLTKLDPVLLEHPGYLIMVRGMCEGLYDLSRRKPDLEVERTPRENRANIILRW